MEEGIRSFLIADQHGNRSVWDLDSLLHFFRGLPEVIEFLNIADIGDAVTFAYRDRSTTAVRIKNNTHNIKNLW